MKDRFKHDVLLRLVKSLDVIAVTVIFALSWYLYYAALPRVPFYYRGNQLMIFLFVLLFILFGRTYDSFLISVSRVGEIVFSQMLAIFFADLVMYVVTVLLAQRLVNPLPLFVAFAVQVLIAAIWAFACNRWYYYYFPVKKSVIIYDVRHGMEALIREYGLQHKYEVKEIVSAKECIDRLQMLDKVDVAFLSGIHSHDRNVILKYCIMHGIIVYVIPRVGDTIMDSARQMHMFHLPILRIDRYNPTPEFVLCKRLFDIVSSAALLVVLSPLMLLTAICIKAEDGGPVFYRQERLTKDGKVFRIIKFRSMCTNAEEDGVARLSSGVRDARITRVGRVIRKFRIDEIPQLFNILSGNMSVVGPRPERPELAKTYEKDLPEFSLRLQGKAGLTGYAQVYGKYNTVPYDKLQMDLMYFAHPSLLEDLRIILATIKILFSPESTEGVKDGQTNAAGPDKPAEAEPDCASSCETAAGGSGTGTD